MLSATPIRSEVVSGVTRIAGFVRSSAPWMSATYITTSRSRPDGSPRHGACAPPSHGSFSAARAAAPRRPSALGIDDCRGRVDVPPPRPCSMTAMRWRLLRPISPRSKGRVVRDTISQGGETGGVAGAATVRWGPAFEQAADQAPPIHALRALAGCGRWDVRRSEPELVIPKRLAAPSSQPKRYLRPATWQSLGMTPRATPPQQPRAAPQTSRIPCLKREQQTTGWRQQVRPPAIGLPPPAPDLRHFANGLIFWHLSTQKGVTGCQYKFVMMLWSAARASPAAEQTDPI